MAKKKPFRLETLLSIRENVLKEKQAELAEAYEAERYLNEQRQETRNAIAATKDDTRAMMQQGSVKVDYLLAMRRYEAYLVAVLEDWEKKAVELAEEIRRRRQAVIEANKEVKILEKLKEKQHDREMLRLRNLDTKTMDEIAEIRAGRLRDYEDGDEGAEGEDHERGIGEMKIAAKKHAGVNHA